MARVEPLGDDARRLLVLAAADDSGDVGTLLRASERLGLGPDAVDAVERAGLLSRRATRLRFRHPLLRSAVYRAAGFAERRAAHEALAAVLDDDADADRRAWHRAAARHRARRRGGRGAGAAPPTTRRTAAGTRPPPARSSARPSSTPMRSGAPRTSSRPRRPRRWPGASGMRWRCSTGPSRLLNDPLARAAAARGARRGLDGRRAPGRRVRPARRRRPGGACPATATRRCGC